ncbi:MAG: deoxyguanosinetriphosphate triphosphohydrolase [Proteobacteria bacterium]|nr:deoxyguanosinetriphosphate triphosphohydrolase [Pseudomonadota bacterium]
MLALYASNPNKTRGRFYDEKESSFRSVFQRDRDRIIHSTAFRRLKHKTQVFLEHESDYFRTRLTHTIEVANVARTLAKALKLDEDLSESIALAHDLGHPPFGHTGEEALDQLMEKFGGFNHNAQALLIVTSLEKHYAKWDGLNLAWETLEGIVKHNGPLLLNVPKIISNYSEKSNLQLETFASAEAQVAALSDDIAYNHHDLLDGMRAKFFSLEEIKDLPIISTCIKKVDSSFPNIEPQRRRHEVMRNFFNILVLDAIEESRGLLKTLNPESVNDIYIADCAVISFSAAMQADLNVVRKFLFDRMYRSPEIVKMRQKATKIVEDLFRVYVSDINLLPEKWRQDIGKQSNEIDKVRIVCNYIAGMTDRYAIQEHLRLTTLCQ